MNKLKNLNELLEFSNDELKKYSKNIIVKLNGCVIEILQESTKKEHLPYMNVGRMKEQAKRVYDYSKQLELIEEIIDSRIYGRQE